MPAPATQQQPESNVNIAVTTVLVPSGHKWTALEFLSGNTKYAFALPAESARAVAANLPKELNNAAEECERHNLDLPGFPG